MEKTHNTEGLGSENISMFFSNSIANKKGFLPRPARFRAWTLEAGREAGSWESDAIRNIMGSASNGEQTAFLSAVTMTSGALTKGTPRNNALQPIADNAGYDLAFDASRVVPTAAENRPMNIAVPVILYLGNLT